MSSWIVLVLNESLVHVQKYSRGTSRDTTASFRSPFKQFLFGLPAFLCAPETFDSCLSIALRRIPAMCISFLCFYVHIRCMDRRLLGFGQESGQQRSGYWWLWGTSWSCLLQLHSKLQPQALDEHFPFFKAILVPLSASIEGRTAERQILLKTKPNQTSKTTRWLVCYSVFKGLLKRFDVPSSPRYRKAILIT